MKKKLNKINIGGILLGDNSPPFIVAELSGNHNQSLERALNLVEAAANCGAHGIKIQTFTPETMTLDLSEGEFKVRDQRSLWFGRSLYELYREAQTPWHWHEAIFRRANELGLIAFSTPFDETSVDFLEQLNVPCYKISSFENTDLELIKKVASTGKPLIISTGMASALELEETVNCARESGCSQLILLKCTSAYPAEPLFANIATIPNIRERFGCHVGLSDHTMGIGVSIASVSLGACVVEKHFTLSRSDGGVDSAFSMEPNELAQLVLESKRAWQSLGKVEYGPTSAEEESVQFRRSLYIVKDMKAGELLSSSNVRAIRPGYGLAPKYYSDILGKPVKVGLKKGTPLAWNLLK